MNFGIFGREPPCITTRDVRFKIVWIIIKMRADEKSSKICLINWGRVALHIIMYNKCIVASREANY